MATDDRSDTRAASLGEMPEPLRGAMRKRLSPGDPLRLLALNPSHTSQGIRSPATLLALTDRRWLLASDDLDGGAAVTECSYDDTLLVELTEILLYGRLKIDFIAEGEPRACAVEFNTVEDRLYRGASLELLRGIEGQVAATPAGRPIIAPAMESWPLMFRNAVPELLPEGRRLAGATHWPAAYGGFGRELAPAAALLITDRELLLISEESAWVPGPRQAKYGYIATYFPLTRLADFALLGNSRLSILELRMHASHGGETLQILFPPDHEQEVSRVLERALQR